MRKDDGRGVMREGLFHDFTRVHARAVDRAAEQFLEGNQAVPVVEMQAAYLDTADRTRRSATGLRQKQVNRAVFLRLLESYADIARQDKTS